MQRGKGNQQDCIFGGHVRNQVECWELIDGFRCSPGKFIGESI